MTRPSKLTPERAQAIVASVVNGATQSAAARAAGVGETTLYAWLRRGEDALDAVTDETLDPLERLQFVESSERLYAEFRQAMTHAQGTIEQAVASELYRDAVRPAEQGGDWRARVAWLERRNPPDWRPPARIEHDATDRLASMLADAITLGEPDDLTAAAVPSGPSTDTGGDLD
jgi:transposase-like protein